METGHLFSGSNGRFVLFERAGGGRLLSRFFLLPIEGWFGKGSMMDAEGCGLNRERLLSTLHPVVAVIVPSGEIIGIMKFNSVISVTQTRKELERWRKRVAP